jgi:general stress protein 26
METRGDPEDVWKAIQKHRIAMLATEEDGRLVSRPMASYGHAEDRRIYFITHLDNNIARPGAAVPVNLAYADTDKNSYLSVSGFARLNQDRQKLHELWSMWAEAWLPQGPEAEDVALIAVEPNSAKLWDASSKLIYAVKMLKAAATQTPLDDGTVKTMKM